MDSIFHLAISVLVLSILVFIHEMGHFLVAKWCKVAVFEFAIGFGKKLYSFKRGETVYSIRAIPLGGFVRMAGDDPSAGENGENFSDEQREELKGIEQSRWFLAKPLWAKTSVVLAGPAFNWISAIMIATASFFFYGKPIEQNLPIIGAVFPDMPAAKSGLKAGDLITELNDIAVTSWTEVSQKVRSSAGQELQFTILRNNDEKIVIKVSGEKPSAEMKLMDGKDLTKPDPATEKEVRIGIIPKFGKTDVGFIESCSLGYQHVMGITVLTGTILKALFLGAIDATKVVGGPLAVFSGAADSAKEGLQATLDFMVLLSVSLAIFNLLPIPVLDGGHLLTYLIEFIRRKPLSAKALMRMNQVGMALLFGLMAFALTNDVRRFFL